MRSLFCVLIACVATAALILVLLRVIVWSINAGFYTQDVVPLTVLAYCFGLFVIIVWLVRRIS